VQRRLLLDVVVSERAAILQLLAGENEALLVGRDACLFAQSQVALSVVVTSRLNRKSPLVILSGDILTLLVLNLGLDVVDGVGRFHLQRDGLAGQRLDENLLQKGRPLVTSAT